MEQAKKKRSGTSATKSKSSNANRKPAAKKRKASKRRDSAARRHEITGILLISGGILLGIYLLFSSSGILGKWLSGLVFGLSGIVGYTTPLLLFGLGLVSIRGSVKPGTRGTGRCLVIGLLAILLLCTLLVKPVFRDTTYGVFIKNAYQFGATEHAGGGFLGAALAYPLLLLGGKALSYVLAIVSLIIVIIIVANLSVRDMGERVGTKVSHAAERVRTEAAAERMRYREEQAASYEKLHIYSIEKDLRPKQAKNGKTSVGDPLDAAMADRNLPALENETPPVLPALDAPVPRDAEDARSQREERESVEEPIHENPNPLGKTRLPRGVRLRPRQRPPIRDDAVEELPLRPAEKADTRPSPLPHVTVFSEKPTGGRLVDNRGGYGYQAPPLTLLDAPKAQINRAGESAPERGKLLVDTLKSFGIETKITEIAVGPVITRFELQPAPGVRVSRVIGADKDIALALAAPLVRIEAPIPGKAAVGIEVPNQTVQLVKLREVVENRSFASASSPIMLAFGKDISGQPFMADLAKMPHLLIAGSTGSGKSVCINGLILSMVLKASPEELKLILIDPKMVELTNYSVLPHLYIPVVTEPKKASGALRWAVCEMTKRYKTFADLGVRNIARYNELQTDANARMPKLVIVIDELADLMMVAPDDVEDSICRIAQLGRAAGIHLIVATQRPSADVITGLIKTNIPSRCAFAVASAIDSRIILDMGGAEKLLGNGDMLFHMSGANKPTRVQGAFVTDDEVERVVEYFRQRDNTPVFDEEVLEEVENAATGGATGGAFGEGKQEDELLPEAVKLAIESKQISTSMIQRRLRVGYARGSRLLDMMEQAGYISEAEGTKPRRVLIKRAEYEQIFGIALPPPGEERD